MAREPMGVGGIGTGCKESGEGKCRGVEGGGGWSSGLGGGGSITYVM
jgi:hypothetical protein